MKLTESKLRGIINEERKKVIREFGGGGKGVDAAIKGKASFSNLQGKQQKEKLKVGWETIDSVFDRWLERERISIKNHEDDFRYSRRGGQPWFDYLDMDNEQLVQRERELGNRIENARDKLKEIVSWANKFVFSVKGKSEYIKDPSGFVDEIDEKIPGFKGWVKNETGEQ